MIRFWRSFLAAVFFAAFGIGGLLISVLLLPMAAFGCNRQMRTLVRFAYRLFVWAADVTGLFRLNVSDADRELLSSMKGKVVALNHLTLIDVVILVSLLPDSTSVAKAAAGRNPFYSLIVRLLFIENDNPEKALAFSVAALADGVNVIVFPEGTRTAPEAKDRHFHRGAAQIALRAGVPVEVFFMHCEPMVLDKRRPWYDVGDRVVEYTITHRATLAPDGEPSRSSAIALTQRIAEALFAR